MKLLVPAEIAAAWIATFAADASTPASLSALIPGGMHYDRVADAAQVPYATVSVTPTEEKPYSLGTVQTFEVQVKVWSGAGVTNAGAIQVVLQNAFATVVPPARGNVVRIRPTKPEAKIEDLLRNAGDVIVATSAWRFVVDVGN